MSMVDKDTFILDRLGCHGVSEDAMTSMLIGWCKAASESNFNVDTDVLRNLRDHHGYTIPRIEYLQNIVLDMMNGSGLFHYLLYKGSEIRDIHCDIGKRYIRLEITWYE